MSEWLSKEGEGGLRVRVSVWVSEWSSGWFIEYLFNLTICNYVQISYSKSFDLTKARFILNVVWRYAFVRRPKITFIFNEWCVCIVLYILWFFCAFHGEFRGGLIVFAFLFFISRFDAFRVFTLIVLFSRRPLFCVLLINVIVWGAWETYTCIFIGMERLEFFWLSFVFSVMTSIFTDGGVLCSLLWLATS